MGHLMRLTYLADQWVADGRKAVFFVPHSSKEYSRRMTHDSVEYRYIEESKIISNTYIVEKAKKILHKGDWIVIDSNDNDFICHEYQDILHSAGMNILKMLFSSDVNCHVDILHNQSILARNKVYDCHPSTRLLLGPQYAILPKEMHFFRELRVQRRRRKRNELLLSFGGSDQKDLTLRILSDILSYDDIVGNITVVTGPIYGKRKALSKYIMKQNKKTINYIHNTNRMVELMNRSDVAIHSGGITTWELACLGVPQIIVSSTENERMSAQECARKGLCSYQGHWDSYDGNHIYDALRKMQKDQAFYDRLARNGMAFVDGKGAERVIAAMDEVGASKIH